MSSKKTKTSVKDLKIKKNPKGGTSPGPTGIKDSGIGPEIIKVRE